MGEAKKRGDKEARIAQAQARAQALRAQFPASVKCESCQADLTDITPMDSAGMDGINLAGAAYCYACERPTWVLNGTPSAVKKVFAELDELHRSPL